MSGSSSSKDSRSSLRFCRTAVVCPLSPLPLEDDVVPLPLSLSRDLHANDVDDEVDADIDLSSIVSIECTSTNGAEARRHQEPHDQISALLALATSSHYSFEFLAPRTTSSTPRAALGTLRAAAVLVRAGTLATRLALGAVCEV